MSYIIKDITPKHYSGRCYAFTITTDKGDFHIRDSQLYRALQGTELRDLEQIPSRAREGSELSFRYIETARKEQ